MEDVLVLTSSRQNQSIKYSSNFFQRLLESYKDGNWVDVERFYFGLLKSIFSNARPIEKNEMVYKLNKDFNTLIKKLADYIITINRTVPEVDRLKIDNVRLAVKKIFEEAEDNSKTIFLNFNYTETLSLKHYANEEEIIHIHGRATDLNHNPIIFGYGDETDPTYQAIEDSGENIYLEHIKSFGYFGTDNYQKLLSFIDSAPYIVYIVGHSCGLSDRVLLNGIFENPYCEKIEIFYYVRPDNSDNFKEITQEISRHFRPQNKGVMRKKVGNKNDRNIIPQNNI